MIPRINQKIKAITPNQGTQIRAARVASAVTHRAVVLRRFDIHTAMMTASTTPLSNSVITG